MNTDHEVSPAILSRFAAKQAAPAEAQVVLRHLLVGCEICRHHLRLAGWHSRAHDMQPFVGNQVPAGPPAGAYDEAFAAAERAVQNALERKCSPVQQLLAELDELSPEQQELRVRNLRRYASPELAAAFVERSHAARFNDHRETLHNARLAVAAAEAATPFDTGGRSLLLDCRTRAWGQLGNAYRIRGEVVEAERAFAQALELLGEGTGDPALRAWLLDHFASLRLFRREFQAAAVVVDEVIDLCRRLHDRSGEATALIKMAIVKIRSGQPAEGIAPLQRAMRLLKPQDVQLLRIAVHNLTKCYLEIGEPRLAYGLMVDAEPHFQTCSDELMLLRMNWLRGSIERDLGLLSAAEIRLARVRETYIRQDLAVEAGVVSLDLAEIYARQGRVTDLVRTVAETIPIFQGLGVYRELLGSLLRLREVAHSQAAAVELIRQITEQMKDALAQSGS